MPNEINPSLYERIKYFIPRLLLPGLDWGDIVLALHRVDPESSEESFWDSWFVGWMRQAQHYQTKAENAREKNQWQTAAENYRRASISFHWAEFMYFHNPLLKEKTRRKVTDCFEQALTLQTPYEIRKVEIPFQELVLPGYFLSPHQNHQSHGSVILINGLDSAKEVELFTFAKYFIERGVSVFIFDGPGQGLLLEKSHLPHQFEKILERVIQYLYQHQWILNDPIGLMGVSFGGLLALRGASLLKNIKACINFSGGSEINDFDQLSPRLRQDFAYAFKESYPKKLTDILRNQSLLSLTAPSCSTLFIQAGFDTIFTRENCQRALQWGGNKMQLKLYSEEQHVCQNYFHECISYFSDWMVKKLTKCNNHIGKTK